MQIHKAQLAEVAPVWHDLALRMKKDPAAQAAFGWILEVLRPLCCSWMTAPLRKLLLLRPSVLCLLP